MFSEVKLLIGAILGFGLALLSLWALSDIAFSAVDALLVTLRCLPTIILSTWLAGQCNRLARKYLGVVVDYYEVQWLVLGYAAWTNMRAVSELYLSQKMHSLSMSVTVAYRMWDAADSRTPGWSAPNTEEYSVLIPLLVCLTWVVQATWSVFLFSLVEDLLWDKLMPLARPNVEHDQRLPTGEPMELRLREDMWSRVIHVTKVVFLMSMSYCVVRYTWNCCVLAQEFDAFLQPCLSREWCPLYNTLRVAAFVILQVSYSLLCLLNMAKLVASHCSSQPMGAGLGAFLATAGFFIIHYGLHDRYN